jgi:small subunit ribosomal protein S17
MTTKTTKKEAPVAKPANRQTLTGVIVSRKMTKTATVLVERYVKHPKYQKHIKRSKKYLVHDEADASKLGDKVRIISVRPMSKMKRFAILDTIGHVSVVEKPSKIKPVAK